MTLAQQVAKRVVKRLEANATSAAAGGGAYTRNPITLTDFKKSLYNRYIHASHLDILDKYLAQVTRHAETNGKEGIWLLIVEMPPRHGKTLTVSRLYPTWHLGRNPDHRVMLVSYGATLAHKNSRYARNLIGSPVYREIFPIELAPGSMAADAWNLAHHEGGMDAMGVLGGATGKGANVLLLDDIVKNREEAESELIRDKLWDALIDDLLTRLEPGGAAVLCATRWHEDDPTGRALKILTEIYPDGKIVRLRLPALAEDGDPIGRKPGEALWSERYPIERLREIELTMGAYSWSALYQQDPVPAEGGLFKRAWFMPTLDQHPPIVRTVRAWDLAMSERTSADFTVGVKIGQAEDGHYYVLDVARKQIDWGDLTPFMADVILKDGVDCLHGIEDKGYMSRAIQNLNQDPRLHNHSIFPYPVDKDKVTRALPYAAKCGAGLVHVMNAHWTQEYIDELCSFNKGAHDDQVDASSGAWAMMDSGVADTVTSFGGISNALTGSIY